LSHCCRVQANASGSSSQTTTVKTPEHRGLRYCKVVDGRKQPIRGLWQCGDRFYARLKAEDVAGRSAMRWFPLFNDGAKEQPCTTAAEAVAAFGDLKSEKRKGKLAKVGQTPLFADFVDEYFKFHDEVRQAGTRGAKRQSTTMREHGPLDLWKNHLSGVRVHKIHRRHIQTFIDARQKAGMTGRTINYDLIALRNVLKRALDQDLIAELPTKNFKPLKHTSPKS